MFSKKYRAAALSVLLLTAVTASVKSNTPLYSEASALTALPKASPAGDLNNDGLLNRYDVELLQKWLVKSGSIPASADFNGDGSVNVFDAVCMRRALIRQSSPPQTTPAQTTAPLTTSATTSVSVTTTALSENEKINAYVERVAQLVNEERAKKGIAPVKINAVMVDAAMLRAKEISTLFSHDRPDGTKCFTVFDDFKIKCSYCSENIAAGSPTPEGTMTQWINSEGHYNNLMSPKVTEIGIGYYCDFSTTYRYYWVQLFRNP